MVPAELLLVQGFGEDALELAAEGVGHEFLDVHDGHVVFATEPMAGLADFGAAGVDDIEKGDLLLPNLNHRIIEGADVLRAFFESSLPRRAPCGRACCNGCRCPWHKGCELFACCDEVHRQ